MIRLRVPATSANLGSGFDSLGLSLNLYNEFDMDLCDHIEISCVGNELVSKDKSNLIFSSAAFLFEKASQPLSGLYIREDNHIPFSRGLGSSSTCIIAGLLGANYFLKNRFSTKDILDFATLLEGHPDNVAPALLGGQITACLYNGHVYCTKNLLPDDLRFLAIIPTIKINTAEARKVLPDSISFKDACFNLSRSALFVSSLANQQYDNLRVACSDRLHQPYRTKLVEGMQDTLNYLDSLDSYASFVSGSGSTMLSILPIAKAAKIKDDVTHWLSDHGRSEWSVYLLKGENCGATYQVLE